MRVSENTAQGSVHEALKKTRGRMEELQIKNATQKKLLTPSDDPASNSKIMDIRTQKAVNEQFENNAVMAKNRLSFTDTALEELTEIFVRAKEIAIGQSSDASASEASRLGVAQEVTSLYNQLISVANRRVGQHYLFGGFKTQTPPYNAQGKYFGDRGEIPIEVQKDVFIMMNVPGTEAFEIKRYKKSDFGRQPMAVDKTTPEGQDGPPIENANAQAAEVINAFQELDALRVGLLTNDTATIRDSLERLDHVLESTVTLRAKVSSRVSTIDSAVAATQKSDLSNAELATKMEDADYADLWSNLAKEETVLRSSLSAAQKLIQPTLLDFLK